MSLKVAVSTLRKTSSLSKLLSFKRVCQATQGSVNILSANMSNGGAQAVDISTNPFFEKYKAKIQHMQETNPEEYEEKLRELQERLAPKPAAAAPPAAQAAEKASTGTSGASDSSSTSVDPPKVVVPSKEAQAGVGMTRQKGLDSVMKLELIQDKTADEITQLWSQYHSNKDCVFAVLKADEFRNLMDKSKEFPVFVFPLPRDEGYEFTLCQFDRFDVYFTSLAMFQMVRENAPPSLTLTHYPELIESHGIVLMAGKFDENVLKQTHAVSLVQLMSIFYGKESRYNEIVRRFNYEPEKFKYEELIDILKSLPQHDMK